MTLSKLRKKYPKFIYSDYFWKFEGKNLEISFVFLIEPDISFNPKLVIKNVPSKIDKDVLNNLVFHLGLIESLGYWKATCSPKIEIRAGKLTKEQIRWWKKLIFDGMGEFFYENNIDWRGKKFLEIKSNDFFSKKRKCFSEKLKRRSLVSVGGGKDSVVTLELLKKASCFSLNPTQNAKKIMKLSGCSYIIVERKIDKKLFELNRKGFLNGHTPFSAYLAFLSILLSVLFDFKYLPFSNERSSNEGNVKYLGKVINHQYSKSFDFEKKFRNYSKRFLSKESEYFSLLRPLYEIQIAKLFSERPKYFTSFISCNEAFKTDSGRKKKTKKWCCNCPKCLFIFAVLYPFLGVSQLKKIFKEDLFEKKSLIPLMEQLTGEKGFKPFECVGTKKESLVAFYLSLSKKKDDLPVVLKFFKKNILPKYPNIKKDSDKMMSSWNKDYFLPKGLHE